MKPKLEKYLFDKYPTLYGETMFTRSFDCGNGWFKIIDQLSKELTENDPQGLVKVQQVKEKFGSFNYYYDIVGTPIDLNFERFEKQIHEIVSKYIKKAAITCEVCGYESEKEVTRDTPEGGYWIRTLCNKCRTDPVR